MAHSLSPTVRSIDKSTGDILWKKVNYPIEQGVVSDGSHLFFDDSSGLFHALDMQTGAEYWKSIAGADITLQFN